MIEKDNSIYFGTSWVQIKSDHKKKVIAVILMSKTIKNDQHYNIFYADYMQFWYILKLTCRAHLKYYIADKESFFYDNLNNIF